MDVCFWGPWKHYIMQLPWKYHSPAATLFPWELGCHILMEGKKSYGGSTSCVLRVPTRTVATVGQHICLHTPQLITLTWIIQFYCFLNMVVSCFPSNARLCSLICSSSSSSRVVLVQKSDWYLKVVIVSFKTQLGQDFLCLDNNDQIKASTPLSLLTKCDCALCQVSCWLLVVLIMHCDNEMINQDIQIAIGLF